MQFKKILVVAAAMVLAASLMAQGGGGGQGRGGQRGGGGPVAMAGRADVQADLGLTDDQKTKITELRASVRQQQTDARAAANGDRDAMTKAMAEITAKSTEELNKILTPDQQKRLKEITIQLAGPTAAAMKDVQDALGLSDDQKAKIADLQKTQRDANTSLQEKMRNQEIQQEDFRAGMTKNMQALRDGINAILTDDQKTKLKAMGGKTFTPAPPAGGGGL